MLHEELRWCTPFDAFYDKKYIYVARFCFLYFLNKPGARIVGGTDGSSLTQKGLRKEKSLPHHVRDYPGREFATSASVYPGSKGPPGR